MPMGVGQLFQTVFHWSLAIVRFVMNKSMDRKPEVNIVIRFYFVKQGILKIKDSKEASQLPRFPQVGLRLRSSCWSLIFAALL